MKNLEDLFNSLSLRLQEYQAKFVEPHIPVDPSESPSSYELDVKAYCLLSHAAFEDFFETVSLNLMSLSIKKWIYEQELTDTLVMLFCKYGLKYELSLEDIDDEMNTYDQIRKLSEEVKRRFSNDVYENNGISHKYLRSLLAPVAIDMNLDVNVSNSLKKLSHERGEYAHKGFVNRSLAPEDALKYVQDCLLLAREIMCKIKNKKWAEKAI